MTKKLPPIHPGEVLLEDFLKPYHLSPYRLAKMTGVPPIRISEIIHGKRAVTAESALLFAKCLGTSPQVWIRLQAQYDLEVIEPQIQKRLARVLSLRPPDNTRGLGSDSISSFGKERLRVGGPLASRGRQRSSVFGRHVRSI
jgi:addiction module HigA family antidote